MVLSCPAAIVALFILELNSTLHQGLPTDISSTPLENHELLVSGTYSQGSTINSSFNNVHILHVQDDPAYNPYFALNNQSGMLYSKTAINVTQGNMSDIGTFLMAVNKHNQSEVEALYCVTYCIGSLTDPSIHKACHDSVSLEGLHSSVNESLLSQHVYERNISQHVAVGYNVLQLALTPGNNKSNVSFAVVEGSSRRLFFVDDQGVLRTGRLLLEEDVATHLLTIAAFANVSDVLQLDFARVTVKVDEENTFPPTFEKPEGYTFSVKEGVAGLSVGFVKAVDRDVGSSGTLAYSFEKQQDTSLFQINPQSGEIKTAKALDRETAESHVFTVVATDLGGPKFLSSQVEVRVLIDDINDNRPVFASREYALSLSLNTQPGPILSLKAEDKDIGKNAKLAYTIIQGNDDGMFWINSSSGELFLVARLTVTANDLIELVVEVVDTFSTNTSFRDTTVVRMTFYDVTSPAARDSSVAVIAGSSVGGVLFIAIVVAVSIWLWKRRKSKQKRRGQYEVLPVISIDQTSFDYEREVCTVVDTAINSSFEIYPPLGVSPIKESSLSCLKVCQVTLGGSEMESGTSLGSLRERSWSFSSVSELSSLSTMGFQSQVTLGGSEMESETSLGSPGEQSWSFSSVSELSSLSTMGFQSQVTLGGSEMESETSLGSPRERAWSFSSVSELSALSTIEFQSGLLQGSQVSLDLGAAEFDSHPALLSPNRTYDRSLSYSEPSIPTKEWRCGRGSHISLDLSGMASESLSAPPTPKRRTSAKEWRYRRGSHVSLDLTGMASESLSAPPTPKRRTSAKERRYRRGSHVSLEFSQMEPELSSSPQASKEIYESPLSPALPLTVPLRSSITGSQVSLDLSCVEAPQSPKQGSEGSLSKMEAAVDYRTTLPTSAESTEGRLPLSSSDDSFRSSKEDFVVEGDDTFASCTGSLSSLQSNRSQDFRSIPSMELGTLQESTSSLYHSADEESTRKNLRSLKPDTLEPDTRDQTGIQHFTSFESKHDEVRRKTVAVPVFVGNAENETLEGGIQRLLPIQSLGRSVSLRTMDFDTMGSQTRPAEEIPQQMSPSESSLSEDKPKASPSRKESTSSIAENPALGTLPESTSSFYYSAHEESARKSVRSSKPETLKPDSSPKKTSMLSIAGISHVSLVLAAEEFELLSISQSSKQRHESSTKGESSSLPTASESTSSIAEGSPISLHHPGMESESQDTPQYLKQRSTSSLCEGEFKALTPPNESGDSEDCHIETSDHEGEGLLTKVSSRILYTSAESTDGRPPFPSSDGSLKSSKEDVDLTRDDASFTSCAGSWSSLQSSRSQDFLDTLQERTAHDVTDSGDEFYSADEEEHKKSIRSLKRDTLKPETDDQSQVQQFASFESTDEVPRETVSLPIVIVNAKKVTPEGGRQRQSQLPIQNLDQSVSLPTMHQFIQDFEKTRSPSPKLRPIKSKTPQIPQKVKKAFKFLKPEKERKRYSKFQQEGSSDDSDNVTEGQPSTARKRFLFFGRKKKRSLSRGETSRQDFSSQTDTVGSALPISSTQQENAPVVTAQTLPSDQSSPSGAGMHSSQETRTDTLTEGSIDLANNNGDSLHQRSSGLSKSNESGNFTTGESMDIEQLEHKKSIDLSKGSFERSNAVTDDSQRSLPETSCESEDIRNIETDLTEQSLNSQSVSRQSIGDKRGLIEGVSLGWSPGQDKSTSSTTSLTPEAKRLCCLSSVSSTLSTSSSEGSMGILGSVHKECQPPSASERLSSQSMGDLELNDEITLKSEVDLTEQILSSQSVSRQRKGEERGLVEAVSLGLSPGQDKSTSSTTPSLNQEAKRCPRRLSSVSSTLSTSSSEGGLVEAVSLGLSPGQDKSTSSTTFSLDQEAKRCLRRLSSVSSTLSTSSSEGSIGSSVRSTGSSSEDSRPLRQSKPCEVLSDSNIQVMYSGRDVTKPCGSPSSSTHAATASVSQSLLPSGGPLTVELSVRRSTSSSSFNRKRSVETISHSQTSETDLSGLHPPLSSSGSKSSQHVSPACSRRDSIEQLSLDERHENVAEVSSTRLLSPDLSSPRANWQETSHEDIGMLVSSMDSLRVSRGRPDDEDTSSETDE